MIISHEEIKSRKKKEPSLIERLLAPKVVGIGPYQAPNVLDLLRTVAQRAKESPMEAITPFFGPLPQIVSERVGEIRQAKEKRKEYEGLKPQDVLAKQIAGYTTDTNKLINLVAMTTPVAPIEAGVVNPQIARSILKVKPGATAKEISASFRQMVKNPKLWPRTLEDMATKYKTSSAKMINEARDVLLKEVPKV